MPADVLRVEDLQHALDRHVGGASWETIGQGYGRRGDAIRKAVQRARIAGRIQAPAHRSAGQAATDGSPSVSWTETPGGATLEAANHPTIRTLDDLLAACDVDLSRWTVERFTVNKWDNVMREPDGGARVTQLFQVKANLRPIPGAQAAAELAAQLVEDMRAHAPAYAPATYTREPGPFLAVVSLADHHFGALAWGPETGEPYDVHIAERLAADAMADLLGKIAPWKPERILYILGHDLLHTDKTLDGKGGTTTRGTIQETDGRWQKTFRIATQASIAAIDAARQLAPVEVHCKAGNHDTASTFMLGDVVAAWYRLDESVTVVNDPAPRSYVEFGVNAIGIAHGHNEKPDKLPLLMATEAPDLWARARYRDWLTGHLHRKGIVMSEESGVQIHTMPSLCAGDSWHVENGYRHRRSSEARIYHREDGPAAHLIFNARRAA